MVSSPFAAHCRQSTECRRYIVVASLVGATWPASLVKLSKIVDTPWMTGIVRADKTGVTLADAIINKVQGERGVTLVGYSLGARVIYSCLMAPVRATRVWPGRKRGYDGHPGAI